MDKDPCGKAGSLVHARDTENLTQHVKSGTGNRQEIWAVCTTGNPCAQLRVVSVWLPSSPPNKLCYPSILTNNKGLTAV